MTEQEPQALKEAGVKATMQVAFALECKDRDGNVLKTIPVKGAVDVPLTDQQVSEAQDGLA